ncbi:MAG: peptidylprolyl isomerase [Chloroflexi bacterium]|nr:peptidylprolyl isomerase [Chloroflexota bacterium]
MKRNAKRVVAPPRPMTKKQLSRYQRERRLNRIAIACVAVVIAVVVLVIGVGIWREMLAKPDEAIARVDGRPISVGNFAKVLGSAQYSYDGQIQRYQDLLATYQAGGEDASQQSTRQFIEQQLQQMRFQRQMLDGQVLDDMIEGELIRQEAERRGIKVSAQEIDQALVQQFTPVSATNPMTSTEAPADQTAAPSDPPTKTKTLDEVRGELRQALERTGLFTESEYHRLALEPKLLKDKLSKAMGDEVQTTAEQVHARHILVDTEQEAKDVREMLNQGQDFGALARERSKDPGSKDKDGDLDWFARGVMTPEFEEAAFIMNPGEISDPVQTTFGYHVIKVEERDANRQLSEVQLAQARAAALPQWLQDQQATEAQKIERLDTPERLKWANNYAAQKRKDAEKRASRQGK